jgi:hypothetical protein
MLIAFDNAMLALNDFVDWVLATVNLPGFKLVTFLLSVTSVTISLWAFRRTKAVLDAHQKSILSDQIRFINREWQKVGRFVLGDEKYLALAAEIFGHSSVDDARRLFFYFQFLNPMFCSFQAFKLGLMDRDAFAGDVKSVLANFKGDDAVLTNAIKMVGYPEDFIAECKNLAGLRSFDAKSVGHVG